MVELDIHRRFDEKLKRKGLVNEDTPSDTVHEQINEDMDFFGQKHKSADYYYHNIESVFFVTVFSDYSTPQQIEI